MQRQGGGCRRIAIQSPCANRLVKISFGAAQQGDLEALSQKAGTSAIWSERYPSDTATGPNKPQQAHEPFGQAE